VFVVDTNILVYAADRDAAFHRRCYKVIEQWRAQTSAWYTTWGIVYEFLRISTHPRVFRNPWSIVEAWGFVEALLASPGLGMLIPTERHPAVAAQVFKELPHVGGNIIHDAHTAVLMREHGIKKIYTKDTDFYKFPFLEPVDPTI
jgi:toxin-antitoxin system PIN domain toxin